MLHSSIISAGVVRASIDIFYNYSQKQESALSGRIELFVVLIVPHSVASVNLLICYNRLNGGSVGILMNYTLESLIKILRMRLQDDEFNGELLTQFLNDSQNEILGEDKYPFMQRIDEYQASADGELNLPLGFAGTFFIYAKKDDQPRSLLKYVAPEDFFNHEEAHTMCYTNFANKIFYRIYKDTDNTGFTIEHLYLVNPLPLKEDSDMTIIPNQYVEALILGALSRAEETRDNYDYAIIYKNQQDVLLTNMKLRYGAGNLVAGNRARLPFGFGSDYDRI